MNRFGQIDSELGRSVHAHLVELGKETPMLAGKTPSAENMNDVKNVIEEHMCKIMDVLGLDRGDDSLMETPKRIAKMYAQELFYGLNYENFPKCTVVENKMGADELVCERGVSIKSMCEHHFLPVDGTASIAYIPGKKVLGLSKLNRIADFFSRRPQVQERLTEQVAYALSHILDTEDVAVVVTARHFCVKMRGVQDQTSDTVTSKLLGRFRENRALRQELLSMTFAKRY